MLRVVLDTNVLVSALLFHGPPNALVHLVLDGKLAPATSSPLLEELRRVLTTKFRYPAQVADLIHTEWNALCTIVEPTIQFSEIPADPTDNRVLECAVSAHADVIVSGDCHLLALNSFRGILILSPQAFLAQWRRRLP